MDTPEKKNADASNMSVNPQVEAHRRIILDGQKKGTMGKALAYARLSGPGW